MRTVIAKLFVAAVAVAGPVGFFFAYLSLPACLPMGCVINW
jgi:hypothetical protein